MKASQRFRAWAVGLVTCCLVLSPSLGWADCPLPLDDNVFFQYPYYISNYGVDLAVKGDSTQESYLLTFSLGPYHFGLRYATTIHGFQIGGALNSATSLTRKPRVVPANSAGQYGWIGLWQGAFGVTPGEHVMRRFFDFDLVALASDNSVFDPQLDEDEYEGDVAVLGNGDVVFVAEKQIDGERRVLYRRFNATGQSQTGQMSVSGQPFTGGDVQERWPTVAGYTVNGERRFVVVWAETLPDDDYYLITLYMRIFRANGVPLTGRIMVDGVVRGPGEEHDLVRPDVWATGGGLWGVGAGIVVAWTSVNANYLPLPPSGVCRMGQLVTYDAGGVYQSGWTIQPSWLGQCGTWNVTLAGSSWAPSGVLFPSMYYLVSWWQHDYDTGVDTPMVKLYRGFANPVEVTSGIAFSPSSSPVVDTIFVVEENALEATRIAPVLFNRCSSDLRAGLAWTTRNAGGGTELRREVIAFGTGATGASMTASTLFASETTREGATDVTQELMAPLYDIWDACGGDARCEAAVAEWLRDHPEW